ncbi:MAG: hypothetical protein ACTSRG_26605 [Candidatus Helarchaeota archaeon]
MGEFEYSIDYSLFSIGKSWVFINPSHGCNLGCAYCIEQKDRWFRKKITNEFSVDETLDEIIGSPFILRDKSPLSFFNYSDPFLKENRNSLMEILYSLDEKGWTNKVGLISKVHPGKDYLKNLSRLRNLKIGLFVSYANLPKGIEKVSKKNRVALIRDAKEEEIPVVDYLRPLISAWTSREMIYELSQQVGKFVDAFCLSGMRFTPEVVTEIKRRNLPIPKIKNYINKQKERDLFDETAKIINSVVDTPVFMHTSCAMSYLFKEPDYNSHDIREKRTKPDCEFLCIPEQRERCYSRECNTTNEEIRSFLSRLNKKIKFYREGNIIFLKEGGLLKEDVSFLRHIIPEFVIKR